jgi:hypothetical protein
MIELLNDEKQHLSNLKRKFVEAAQLYLNENDVSGSL